MKLHISENLVLSHPIAIGFTFLTTETLGSQGNTVIIPV